MSLFPNVSFGVFVACLAMAVAFGCYWQKNPEQVAKEAAKLFRGVVYIGAVALLFGFVYALVATLTETTR